MTHQAFTQEDLSAPRIRLRNGIVYERFDLDENVWLEEYTVDEWRTMLLECHTAPVFLEHKKFQCMICPPNLRRGMQKHRLNNHRRNQHEGGFKFYPTGLEQNWVTLLLEKKKTPEELIQEWRVKHPDGMRKKEPKEKGKKKTVEPAKNEKEAAGASSTVDGGSELQSTPTRGTKRDSPYDLLFQGPVAVDLGRVEDFTNDEFIVNTSLGQILGAGTGPLPPVYDDLKAFMKKVSVFLFNLCNFDFKCFLQSM